MILDNYYSAEGSYVNFGSGGTLIRYIYNVIKTKAGTTLVNRADFINFMAKIARHDTVLTDAASAWDAAIKKTSATVDEFLKINFSNLINKVIPQPHQYIWTGWVF